MYGWKKGIYKKIQERLNKDEKKFIVKKFGMMYNEIKE